MATTAHSIYNPLQGDRVTFLAMPENPRVDPLVLHVELDPGGENAPHKHLSATETFEPIDGPLWVLIEKEESLLHPGDRVSVPPGTAHRFANHAGAASVFRVELTPGGKFGEALRVAYGLAADGKVTKQGVPRNILYASYLFAQGDTYLATLPIWLQRTIFSPFVPVAVLAEKMGALRSLQMYTDGTPV